MHSGEAAYQSQLTMVSGLLSFNQKKEKSMRRKLIESQIKKYLLSNNLASNKAICKAIGMPEPTYYTKAKSGESYAQFADSVRLEIANS